MRYRTRKRIIRFFLYLLYTAIIAASYSLAAHKKLLPAFFEFYTGDATRNLTRDYYARWIGEDQQVAHSVMDTVDLILRESTYLYVADVFGVLGKSQTEIPLKIQNEGMALSTFPALIEWLKNPRGEFASVYQYETSRYIEASGIFSNYVILDKNGKLIYSHGKVESNYDSMKQNPEFEIYNGLVSLPVKSDNQIAGRIIATAESRYSLNLGFQKTGLPVSWILMDGENRILASEFSPGAASRWVREGIYSGRLSGIHDGERFLARKLGGQVLVVIYPAETFSYYALKALIVLTFLGLVFFGFLYWKKISPFEYFAEIYRRSRQDKGAELLEKSNLVNQEYAALALKVQGSMQAMKMQEVDRLRMISEHLTYLHRSLYKPEEEVVEVKNLD